MQKPQKLILNHRMSTLNEYTNAERTNRFMGAKIKKQCTDLCAAEAKSQLKKISGPCIYEFTWIEKNRMRDPDNICFPTKFILDGLVKAKIIENDGHKQILSLHHNYEFRDYVGVELKIIPAT